jgi:hypothetical protein
MYVDIIPSYALEQKRGLVLHKKRIHAQQLHFHARLCRRLNDKYYVRSYQEKLSGLELWINTCGKVPLQDCFLDDEILVWSL